jgi:hypothetical protein
VVLLLDDHLPNRPHFQKQVDRLSTCEKLRDVLHSISPEEFSLQRETLNGSELVDGAAGIL